MSNKKYFAKHLTFVCVCLAVFMVWITYEQDHAESKSTPEPTEVTTDTPTPTEEVIIEFIDGVPTAVAFTATPTTVPTPTPQPTFTPTHTPSPTEIPPTPTQKPTEGVKKAKATNTPSPTEKPVKTQNTGIVPYPTGKVGTQYTDDPDGHTWKPYARYWKITKENSVEYKLRCMESTAENGLRIVQDPNGVWRYCIALEPQWAGGRSVDIGRCIDIKMTNGAVLHCVLADCKTHENSYKQEGRYGSRGELIEFIVDETKLPEGVHGDISNVSKEFRGGIVSVTVLDLYIKGFGGK